MNDKYGAFIPLDLKIYFLFLFSIFSLFSFGQNDLFVIHTLTIEGNKKTKTSIIQRELNLQVGDSVSITKIMDILKQNELQVLNTGLFTQANFKLNGITEKGIDLLLTVVEDWYIYPIPVFELADRNFNVWWVEQNRSLKRVNYGLYVIHKSLTGRKDPLKVAGLLGYGQKINITYAFPYLNKKQTLGVKFDYLFARNREIGFTTDENKLQFNRFNDEYLLHRFRLNSGLTYRPNIKTFHEWNLFFYKNKIHSHVLDINPNFFKHNTINQKYFALNYQFIYENRNFQPYPTKGNYLNLKIQKEGLSIFDDLNVASLTAWYKQYFPLSKKWSAEIELKGRKTWQNEQIPYYNSQALGYFDDYLRGYEYYVIDGQDFGFLKTGLRYQLINGHLDLGRFMPINAFKIFPFQVFLAFNTDHGYVNNGYYSDGNSFANSYLQGIGIGLDFLLYSNRLIEIEYSRNHLGEKGLYLHLNLFF